MTNPTTVVADRTLTIDASDVHVGRTYELKIDNADATESPDATVTVTAASGETADCTQARKCRAWCNVIS